MTSYSYTNAITLDNVSFAYESLPTSTKEHYTKAIASKTDTIHARMARDAFANSKVLHGVLAGVSLKVPKGKIVALMGGSGSGKTTILKMISGQYAPTAGSIQALGQNIATLNKANLQHLRQRIGVLFQFGALFTDLSVHDNIAFSLKEHTTLPSSIISRLVKMKLQAVGLPDVGNMATYELSGGMAKRIALARAIALDPELMLYDEPFTGLDPIALNVIAMLIRRLNDLLGQSTLIISHDVPSTLKIADYIYILGNKQIIAQGTPEEIKQSEDAYVQQFLGRGSASIAKSLYHNNTSRVAE